MNRVYTGGTFDLFHEGHVNFLKNCAVLGEVIVSLNTDEFVERFKGKRPIIPFEGRKKVLDSCRYVNRVIENTGNEDSKEAILTVRPDIIAIGTDWATKDYYKQMGFTREWLEDHSIMLVYIPYTEGISSTLIRQYLNDNR